MLKLNWTQLLNPQILTGPHKTATEEHADESQ